MKRSSGGGPVLGGDEMGTTIQLTLFREQLIRFFEALTALRRLAERGIDRFRITRDTAPGTAELVLANRIANTDVHDRRISELAGD